MNRYIIFGIITIILIILFYKNNKVEKYIDMQPVYWPLDYKYGQTNIGTVDNTNDNTLFTAHPLKLACSKDQNEWTKHIRLHHSGGVMYTSNHPPLESQRCQSVACPPLIQDYNTLKDVDHYDPYPLRRDKLKCWCCK